jgi:hypothetical protein
VQRDGHCTGGQAGEKGQGGGRVKAGRRVGSKKSGSRALVSMMPLFRKAAGKPTVPRCRRAAVVETSCAPHRPAPSPASPLVLMLSRPHRLTATVSGQDPPLACLCASRIASAALVPRSMAASEGMRYGSSAWMLRPVGSTPAAKGQRVKRGGARARRAALDPRRGPGCLGPPPVVARCSRMMRRRCTPTSTGAVLCARRTATPF